MKLKVKKFYFTRSEVVYSQEIAENRYLLRIKAPEIAKLAWPGQFVQIKIGDYDPLLPRPFSVSYTEKDFIEILFDVRGKGTSLLSQMRKGEFLSLLGPLGRGFLLPEAKDTTLVLVAGGVGLAPLRFLAWKATTVGYSSVLLYGEKNASRLLPLLRLLPEKMPKYWIAEKGKRKGVVTDLLKEVASHLAQAHYFVCGPKPMLKEVQKFFAQKGITKVQFSFEERMGCGYGACLGCVIPVEGGYKKVCQDGPVFKGDEIKWQLI